MLFTLEEQRTLELGEEAAEPYPVKTYRTFRNRTP